MTPSEFEKKLEADYQREFKFEPMWATGYRKGAKWAREETLREVLGALRSEEASEQQDGRYKNGNLSNDEWADWLEEKLQENK